MSLEAAAAVCTVGFGRETDAVAALGRVWAASQSVVVEADDIGVSSR